MCVLVRNVAHAVPLHADLRARAALVHRAKLHDTGSEMTQAEVNNLKRQLHADMKKKKRTQCPE